MLLYTNMTINQVSINRPRANRGHADPSKQTKYNNNSNNTIRTNNITYKQTNI